MEPHGPLLITLSTPPYRRTNPDIPPYLSVLRDFDGFDKHRLLHVAVFRPVDAQFKNIRYSIKGNVPFMYYRDDADGVKKGGEIAKLIFRLPEPHAQAEFTSQLTIEVSHAKGPTEAVSSTSS
ncbi:MAG: hypothetical protein ABIP65_08210 [Vicinamibacterales bacterium]